MLCLHKICPSQLVIISSIIVFVICDDRDSSQLNVIGNVIVAIGSLVLVWAAQKDYLDIPQESVGTKEDIMLQIKKLQLQCDKLNDNAK